MADKQNAEEFLLRLDRDVASEQQKRQEELSRRKYESQQLFKEWYPIIEEYLTALARRHFGGEDFTVKLNVSDGGFWAYYYVIGSVWHVGQKRKQDSYDSAPCWVDARYKRVFWIEVRNEKDGECTLPTKSFRPSYTTPLTEDSLRNVIADLHKRGPKAVFEGEHIDYKVNPFSE